MAEEYLPRQTSVRREIRMRSTYPIPTRDAVFYIANDGEEFDNERKCRQHNAKLAIREICAEQGWQGVVTSDDVAEFIMMQSSALGPWFDDLCG